MLELGAVAALAGTAEMAAIVVQAAAEVDSVQAAGIHLVVAQAAEEAMVVLVEMVVLVVLAAEEAMV